MQRLAAAQQLLRQNPSIVQATDAKPFPLNALNAQIRQALPPDVKTWKQLKQWATQNPALLPNVDINKLIMLQVLHLQDIVKQSGGMPSFQAQQANNGLENAHQAQLANMPPIQVTPQEIMTFRQMLQGNQNNVTDEQIRKYIHTQKMKGRMMYRRQ